MNRKNRGPGKSQWQCAVRSRASQRAWYRANRERAIAHAARVKRAHSNEALALLVSRVDGVKVIVDDGKVTHGA